MAFDQHKTKAMTRFLAKEAHRVTGLSIEGDDGVFIYCTSAEWCDDNGSGTFHGDNETAAIKAFYDRVQPGNGNAEYPQPLRLTGPYVEPQDSEPMPCNRKTFKAWFSAVRACRKIGDNSPLGPYFGVWHYTSALDPVDGLQRRNAPGTVSVAFYRQHALDLSRHGMPHGTGKHYRKLMIEGARRMREMFSLQKRLPS